MECSVLSFFRAEYFTQMFLEENQINILRGVVNVLKNDSNCTEKGDA